MTNYTKPMFILVFCLAQVTLYAQEAKPGYNKALADSLGSDDYGMKSYVLVILKTGPTDVQEKSLRDSLFRGHMANINRLVADGKLIVAGPLKKNDKTYRGIFILNVPTVEEARTLVLTDPAVSHGMLEMEMYQWYGSAALPMYLKYHDRIGKKSF
ncbi:MAG TPA: YciI family protein [Flavisolibacter sp.]